MKKENNSFKYVIHSFEFISTGERLVFMLCEVGNQYCEFLNKTIG